MFRKLTSAADAMTIAPGMVMISLSAIALGAAFGGYLPLIALWMETLEVSFQQIGIVSGTSALGIICSAYFAPQLAQKYGYVVTINIGLVLAAVMTVLFRYTENYACMAGDPVRQWAWPWPALGSNRSMARKYRFRPGTYTGNGNLCHRHFCWLRRWPSNHLVIRFFHANTILPNRIVSTYCGLAHLQTSQTRTKGRIF